MKGRGGAHPLSEGVGAFALEKRFARLLKKRQSEDLPRRHIPYLGGENLIPAPPPFHGSLTRVGHKVTRLDVISDGSADSGPAASGARAKDWKGSCRAAVVAVALACVRACPRAKEPECRGDFDCS
jgi:hypothetical protein